MDPNLALGLVGGMTGASRGKNADHDFTFVSHLYAERASQRSVDTWLALMHVAARAGSQADRNQKTLQILHTQLYLRGLCQEQAVRLLCPRESGNVCSTIPENTMPALRLLHAVIPEAAWPSECGHHQQADRECLRETCSHETGCSRDDSCIGAIFGRQGCLLYARFLRSAPH